MPECFFLPDCHGQGSVHLQQVNRCASNRSLPEEEECAGDVEVVLPPMQTRIEDLNHFTGVRICCMCPRSLSQGTRDTGKRQIREHRWALVPSGPNMIDMKRSFLTNL